VSVEASQFQMKMTLAPNKKHHTDCDAVIRISTLKMFTP